MAQSSNPVSKSRANHGKRRTARDGKISFVRLAGSGALPPSPQRTGRARNRLGNWGLVGLLYTWYCTVVLLFLCLHLPLPIPPSSQLYHHLRTLTTALSLSHVPQSPNERVPHGPDLCGGDEVAHVTAPALPAFQLAIPSTLKGSSHSPLQAWSTPTAARALPGKPSPSPSLPARL